MSSFSTNQKCNSPKPSAQALLARQFLEEHGWKVVENQKSKQNATTSPISDNEVATSVTSDPNHPQNISAGNGDVADESVVTSNGTQYHRTKRGISNTESNFSIVNDIQDLVCDVFTSNNNNNDGGGGGGADSSNDQSVSNSEVRESFKHTFVLPNLCIFPLEFREFLHKELIETSTLVSLEQTGRLNWWYDLGVCQRLLPLATTGDGNCLLHAASLGIWGFHDRRLTLRTALHDMLTTSRDREAFKRRWKYHQEQVNKQSGLIYNEKEWTEEWDNLVKLASPQPRPNCDQPPPTSSTTTTTTKSPDIFYESLEELHVFVLAHILGRPIIITADTILKDCNGDALAPISFGGIYLPLEISPHSCHRSPLVLSYDSAHFSALVRSERYPAAVGANSRDGDCVDEPTDAIPLVDSSLNLLPIHFLVDPNNSVQSDDTGSKIDESNILASESLHYDAKSLSIISKYLDIQVIPIPSVHPDRRDVGPEISRTFSHLSLKLKSGSCNDIARVALPSHSSTPKSSTLTGANGSKDKETLSFSYSESSKNGEADGAEEDGGRVRAPSSLTSSPLAKGRMKLPQMAQNMVKTFNSLGRTVKKKIRQSSSSSPFKKSDKKNGTTENKKPFKMSESLFRCGSLKKYSEGSKSSVFPPKILKGVEMGNGDKSEGGKDCGVEVKALVLERNSVLCAKLIHTKQPYQDEMMRNYLESAWQRFDAMKQDKLTTNGFASLLEPTTDCINEGCDGLATQETSYLCRDCFERHKKEELEHERTNMAAKVINRKSALAIAPVVSTSASVPGKASGISAPAASGSNSNSGFSVSMRRNHQDAVAPMARFKRPVHNERDDEDEDVDGNANNSNSNDLDDLEVRLQYFTSASTSTTSPPSSSSSSSLRSSTIIAKPHHVIKPTPSFLGSHQFTPSSSPRERKPPPNNSYFSNFASSSSALGRVESGPKLPVFPGSPGKRSSIGSSPHRITITRSPTPRSPLTSRLAQSPSYRVSGNIIARNFNRGSGSNMDENIWSSRNPNQRQHNPQQQQQQSNPQQRGSLQQQNLQHSQQQLHQSLLYLQQQSLPTNSSDLPRPIRSRQFEESLEHELYSMSQSVRNRPEAGNPVGYRGYSNGRSEDAGSASDGDFGLPRESSVIGCQQFEF